MAVIFNLIFNFTITIIITITISNARLTKLKQIRWSMGRVPPQHIVHQLSSNEKHFYTQVIMIVIMILIMIMIMIVRMILHDMIFIVTKDLLFLLMFTTIVIAIAITISMIQRYESIWIT